MNYYKLNPRPHILEQVKPALAGRLAALPLTGRRAVAAMACKQAAEAIPNLESEIVALVDSCVRENCLSPAQVAAAQSFAKWADERYFDLKDKGVHKDVWRTWFQKARLATALNEAFGGDSWEGTANAIYELSVTWEDTSNFIKEVESAIEKMNTTRQPM